VTVIVLDAVAVLPRLSVIVTRQVCVPEEVNTPLVCVAEVAEVDVDVVEMTVAEAFVTVKV
jgi:hypothetical protein